MNLEKAIEILEGMLFWSKLSPESDSVKAIKLGIEALREISRARVVSLFPDNHQLLGETKE